MTNYKIVVAYDGTDYHGWQAQPGATTICQSLIDAYASVFFQKISILGASRTDAGVHALGQVAIVRSPINLPADAMLKAWNKAIPSDIVIREIYKLESLIHPHDGVTHKTYAYYFFTSRPMPMDSRYGYFVKRPVDFDKLEQALQVFIGTHDFRSFCTGSDLQDTVRTVSSIKVSFDSLRNGYRIEIKGNSFLRYMIRRIVGACLQLACYKDLTVQDLKKVLLEKNPCHTLPNAPAKGLILEHIEYMKDGA